MAGAEPSRHADGTGATLNRFEPEGQRDSCAMHDPLAVAVVTHPELVTFVDAHVSIVTGDGQARGVMITDLLRTAWGFEGLVVSDWGAVNDRVAALALGAVLQ